MPKIKQPLISLQFLRLSNYPEVFMRKIFTVSIFCLLAAAIVSSCFIEDDDYFDSAKTLSETPILISSGSAIAVASTPTVSASIANIFRQACADEDFDENVEDAVNIAQITSSKDFSEIAFTDSFTDSAKYYRYAIRYKDGNSFKITKYSKVVAEAGTGEAELSSSSSEASLLYEDSGCTLSTTEAITSPADFSEAYLILTSGTESTLVKIEDEIQSGTLAAGAKTGSLQNKLPSSFLGEETAARYMIAINEETSGSSTLYYFTNPLAAAIQIKTDGTTETVGTITVPAAGGSSSSSGIYYN